MKKVMEGFITYRTAPYKGEVEYRFQLYEGTDYGYTTVMPYSIEVDIPDSFDPRAAQVKVLQAEKIKLMADFQARCTQIERQISELTAITCEVEP